MFRLITTFDEVPPKLSRVLLRPGDLCIAVAAPHREIYGVDLKRVPPKSRPPHDIEANLLIVDGTSPCTRLARTPPSTFLFLPIHLSNSPGLATPFSPDVPESLRSSCHQLK